MTPPLLKKLPPDGLNLLCIVGLAVAIMLPVYFLGIPDGADLGQHIRFAARYHDGIVNGNWFPGWSGEDNYGFGSAGIRVYPPFAYYVLAVTRITTGDWYTAMFADVLLWMLAGCIGVYLWVRERGDPRMALLAAAIYSLVPYHLCQFYQMVLFAEFAAAGVIPFCFLFAQRIVSRGRAIDVLSFAAAYALLLLTHIPTSLIASMALGVYVLLIIEKGKLFTTTWKFAVAFTAALACGAFYLVRLATEVSWVQHDGPQYYLNGYYSYKQYFFPMVLVTTRNYAGKMLWHLDIQIVLTILLFVAPLAALVRHWRKGSDSGNIRESVLPFTIAGAFCFFMLSALSMPIWDRVTLLQKLQFPWRWLSVFSLFAAAAGSAGFIYIRDALPRSAKLLAYMLGGLIFAIVLFDLTQSIIQSSPLSRDAFHQKIAALNTEENCQCWWPVGANDKAFTDRSEISGDGLAVISSRRLDQESLSFRLAPGPAANARLPVFFYPHWHAYANGRAVPTGMDENGALTVGIPSDTAQLDLRFEEPPRLVMARWASIACWVALLCVLLFLVFRKRMRNLSLPLID